MLYLYFPYSLRLFVFAISLCSTPFRFINHRQIRVYAFELLWVGECLHTNIYIPSGGGWMLWLYIFSQLLLSVTNNTLVILIFLNKLRYFFIMKRISILFPLITRREEGLHVGTLRKEDVILGRGWRWPWYYKTRTATSGTVNCLVSWCVRYLCKRRA